MRRHWPIMLLSGVAVVFGGCCALSLNRRDDTGGLGRFDLGEGRAVHVWSQPQFGDPRSLWAEVQLHGRPLHRPLSLGLYRQDGYRPKTVWTTDRNVSVTFGEGDEFLFAVYVDWNAAKVWRGNDEDLTTWRERYRELRTLHPELPRDGDFE